MSEISLNDDFEVPSLDQWLALVDKVLKGADFDQRLVSRSSDGLRIKPLYTRADATVPADTATPGAAPFQRGTSASVQGYGWDIRQSHGDQDPVTTNKAILSDLSGGVNSITVEMAAPGQAGLPTDAAALQQALQAVDLTICPVALGAGENFGAAAAYLLGAWASRRIGKQSRAGAFNADPLGTLASTGGQTLPLPDAINSACALIAKTQELPQVSAMIADGRPYHNGGASEAQELAAMASTLVAYLRAAEAAAIAPDKALPKITIGLSADADQFLTIGKLRAARGLIWRIADAANCGFAAKRCHITATTSWRMMARRDPWVNMLRTTIACAAAAMGGADAICVLPFTAALGKPDAFARRIARNTQIVLQEESALGRVIDPAGGSWYVEKLTDDLARKAWDIFQQIEGKGGMGEALQSGFVQDMIAETAAARDQKLATGSQPITGVSSFARLGDDGVAVMPHDHAPDHAPAVMTAGKQIAALSLKRLAEPFEGLRDTADAIAARTGKAPQIFLVNLGEIADFNARAQWARNFFAAGGIEAIGSDGFTNTKDAGAAFAASGAKLACLCSSDEVYGELGEAAASLLKTAGADMVYLAGQPANKDALASAGVDGFIFAGCDMLQALDKALTINQTAP